MRTSGEIPDFVETEYLSASQLASNFGWPESFINELVSNARLPGIKTGGIWNFRRDDVIDWLEQRIQTLDSQRVGQLETRVEHSLVADGSYRRPIAPDRLVSRMPDDGITLDAPIDSKSGVLRALVSLAERTGLLYDRDSLLESLINREALSSTAMPGGVALCHPRRPVPNIISTQFVCFLRTLHPVDFGSHDGKGTTLFFLLCAPDDRSHLFGLARVARILHQGGLEKLKQARTAAQLKLAITSVEGKLSARIY